MCIVDKLSYICEIVLLGSEAVNFIVIQLAWVGRSESVQRASRTRGRQCPRVVEQDIVNRQDASHRPQVSPRSINCCLSYAMNISD